MAIIEDRLSTSVVAAPFIEPDGAERIDWLEDHERGPRYIADPTNGLLHQNWRLDYDNITGDFVLTPETFGLPHTVLSGISGVQQCTFTFDQNANPCVTYTRFDLAHMYWYDTESEQFITTQYPADVIHPSVTMDDKRQIHVDRNDILLFYTRDMGDGTYNFYHRKQRERYTVEHLLKENTPPRIKKFGMHQGLRVQLYLTFAEQI